MKHIKKINEGFRDWFKSKPKSEDLPEVEKSINLDDECKLRFTKDDRSQYIVSFYNPGKDSYWDLPDGSYRSAIHAPWSFDKKGSYGAYDLNKMKCRYDEIESYKKQYKTLGDIQHLFDEMNTEYEDFTERRRKDNELPNVVERMNEARLTNSSDNKYIDKSEKELETYLNGLNLSEKEIEKIFNIIQEMCDEARQDGYSDGAADEAENASWNDPSY